MLDVLNQEKSNLENRQEELEKQKIRDLEEKLANVKRLYGEMKYHLVLFCLKSSFTLDLWLHFNLLFTERDC